MLSQETFSTEGLSRQPVAEVASPPSQLPRVLLVEDERVSRRALAALLSASGYPTEAVGTAEEALRLIESLGSPLPRIALVDLNLPGMNGLDLIERLERLDPNVFPVLITAQGGDSLLRMLHSRRVSYMQKPINFDRLLAILAEGQTTH